MKRITQPKARAMKDAFIVVDPLTGLPTSVYQMEHADAVGRRLGVEMCLASRDKRKIDALLAEAFAEVGPTDFQLALLRALTLVVETVASPLLDALDESGHGGRKALEKDAKKLRRLTKDGVS